MKTNAICLIDSKTTDELGKRWKEKASEDREMIVNYLSKSSEEILPTDKNNAFASSFQCLENKGYLMGRDFFKLIPGGNLCAEYDNNWNIIGFKLIDKSKVVSGSIK